MANPRNGLGTAEPPAADLPDPPRRHGPALSVPITPITPITPLNPTAPFFSGGGTPSTGDRKTSASERAEAAPKMGPLTRAETLPLIDPANDYIRSRTNTMASHYSFSGDEYSDNLLSDMLNELDARMISKEKFDTVIGQKGGSAGVPSIPSVPTVPTVPTVPNVPPQSITSVAASEEPGVSELRHKIEKLRVKRAVSDLDTAREYAAMASQDAGRHSIDQMTRPSARDVPVPRSASELFRTASPTFLPEFGATDSPTWRIGELLQSLGDKDKDATYLVQKANDLVVLLKEMPELRQDIALEAFGYRIQSLLLYPQTEIVACGFRIARHALNSAETVRGFRNLRMDFFLCRSLARDPRNKPERIQAFKYIRAIPSVSPRAASEISIAVCRALVAIADQPGDPFRNLAIETLCELLLFVPHTVAAAQGLRTLLQCISEGPFQMSRSCCAAVGLLVDSPFGRSFLQGGLDMQFLASGFTELQTRPHLSLERLQNGAVVLAAFLKTFPGLLCFCRRRFQPMRTLVAALLPRTPILRDVVMDVFLDVLGVRQLPWLPRGKTGPTGGAGGEAETGKPSSATGGATSSPSSASFPNSDLGSDALLRHRAQYAELVAAVLRHAGLPSALVAIIQDGSDRLNARKAVLLLSELTARATDPAPAPVDPAGCLVARAVAGSPPAIAGVCQMEKAARRAHGNPAFPPTGLTGLAGRRAILRAQRAALRAALRVSRDTRDDAYLRQLIADTGVLATKLFRRWDWPLLLELLQGPLRDPRRLEDVLRNTKFIKRLLSFFRPFKFRYSALRTTRGSARYTKVGCATLRALLRCPAGVAYLADDKLLRQLSECLAQLDPTSGIRAEDPLFSRQRLATTLAAGYFEFLGVLSGDRNGVRMLTKWRMFNMLYHLVALPDREDLAGLVVAHLACRRAGHSRVILARVLRGGEVAVKEVAVERLGRVLLADDDAEAEEAEEEAEADAEEEAEAAAAAAAAAAGGSASASAVALPTSSVNSAFPSATGSDALALNSTSGSASALASASAVGSAAAASGAGSTAAWAVQLLTHALYDPSASIRLSAARLLDQYCARGPAELESVVRQRPVLHHLGAGGTPLVLRFLACSSGFAYLSRLNFVEAEMSLWMETKNSAYVRETDRLLLPEVGPWRWAGPVPQHFFGELVKTEEGCQLLHRAGHFISLCLAIRRWRAAAEAAEETARLGPGRSGKLGKFGNFSNLGSFGKLGEDAEFDRLGSEPEWPDYGPDSESVLHVRGCIWAVGHVGSSELGVPLLDESGIVAELVALCRSAPVWSVRGTCFLALGLVASTAAGAEILDELGWRCAFDEYGEPRGLTLPEDLEAFFGAEDEERAEVVGGANTVDGSGAELSDSYVLASDGSDSDMDLELAMGPPKAPRRAFSYSADGAARPSFSLPRIAARGSESRNAADPVTEQILSAIANLSSPVLANDAAKEISKLETRHRDRFGSPELLLKTFEMMEQFRFRQTVRTFLWDIFTSTKALERLIRRDRAETRDAQGFERGHQRKVSFH